MALCAMDFGLKRIGLALEAGGVILPLDPIIRKNRNQAAGELKSLLDEKKIDTLVVGIPLGGSSEEEMRRRISHFISLVEFPGKVIYVDEADSSLEAEDSMKGVRRDRKDGKMDSLAARIILERYLRESLHKES